MQKFFSLILVVSLSAYSLNAQVIDKVKLRIHYATKFRVWENTKGMRQDEKVLDLGTTSSKFYSLWETRYWEIVDSVAKHGGSMQNALAHSPYPRSYDCYVVYKNYPIKGELTYTDKLLQDFIYQESMEKPVWRLVKGKDSIVANYRCQKAQTKYRGKVWNVWYTIDIPISDGPWKLYGLPGLILKAEDQDGNFVFECGKLQIGVFSENAINANVNVTVYNSVGQQVAKKTLNAKNNIICVPETGIYLVSINSNGLTNTQKIILR